MIWMTWRQHRREALIFALIFAAIAIYIVVLGHAMYDDYYHMTGGVNVAQCRQQPAELESNLCQGLIGTFNDKYGNYSATTQQVVLAIIILPALVGMFVGAPMVSRELESGTFRLAWTQSVTRRRWLLTKIGMLAGALLLVVAAFIPLIFWWEKPFALGDSGLGSLIYPIEGILPLAYMLFGLTLGFAAGTLLRRTVAAVGVTLAAYVATALAIYIWARPNLLPPISTTWDSYLTDRSAEVSLNAWTLYNGYIDRAGHHISYGEAFQTCAPDGRVIDGPGTAYAACIHAHGWLTTIIWQPADRFWAFQGIESALLAALALALVALTLWLVRRRIV